MSPALPALPPPALTATSPTCEISTTKMPSTAPINGLVKYHIRCWLSKSCRLTWLASEKSDLETPPNPPDKIVTHSVKPNALSNTPVVANDEATRVADAYPKVSSASHTRL